MHTSQLWQAALGELELILSKPNFSTWFKETFIVSFENDKIIIGVPNTFTKTWLERKYHSMILKSLRNTAGAPVKEIIYKVENRKNIENNNLMAEVLVNNIAPVVNEPIISYNESSEKTGNINNRYTFDNFVVGKTSALAHAACLATANQPGTVYNPLFLYGGVGLGKTHLLQAIGNHIATKHPRKKILYATSEKFANDYIQAVRSGKAKEFKDKYRTVDVLLIDDVQFLASKEGTQEEFFHTFNALHQTDRQLVFTSDRPPKAIPAIESRLLSRLEWGMTADIVSPDLETRTAILEAKCREKKIQLTTDVLNYIATMIHSNVRELEGALNRIIAYTQLNNTSLSLEKIKQIVASVTSSYAKKSLTPKQLINTVAEFFDLTIEDVIGECRKKELAEARQIIMFLMREELKCSYPSIGQELGGRDHTTAMHAYTKINRELEVNPKLKQDIDFIRQRIYNI